MLKINITGLNKAVRATRQTVQQARLVRERYFRYLTQTYNIGEKLRQVIEREVYGTSDPVWYERTYSLLKPGAIRLQKRQSGKTSSLILTIDDSFLASQSQAREPVGSTAHKFEYGYAVNAHGPAASGYLKRIIEGFEYENIKLADSTTEPRPFDETFIEELNQDILSGNVPATILVEPILRVWR